MLQAAWQQYAAYPARAAVQLNFVETQVICGLHAEYFGDAHPTDVITFPLAGPGLFGEIYVCYEVALTQARRYKVPSDVELARLALHGVLHLLGFNDLRPSTRRQMRALENQFLTKYFPDRNEKAKQE